MCLSICLHFYYDDSSNQLHAWRVCSILVQMDTRSELINYRTARAGSGAPHVGRTKHTGLLKSCSGGKSTENVCSSTKYCYIAKIILNYT